MVIGAGCVDQGDRRRCDGRTSGTQDGPRDERREDDRDEQDHERGHVVLAEVDPAQADDGSRDRNRDGGDQDHHLHAGPTAEVAVDHVALAGHEGHQGDDDQGDSAEAREAAEHVGEGVEADHEVDRAVQGVEPESGDAPDHEGQQDEQPDDDLLLVLLGVCNHWSAPSPLGI